MIFNIHHTHFELTTYINFGFHNSKDNRDIARNVAAFWVIQAITDNQRLFIVSSVLHRIMNEKAKLSSFHYSV